MFASAELGTYTLGMGFGREVGRGVDDVCCSPHAEEDWETSASTEIFEAMCGTLWQ